MEENSAVPEESKKEIAGKLYEVGGIKFGEFTLTSGKTSPYYVDLRVVPSYPELFDEVAEACAAVVKEIDGNYKLAGIPTGGLPLATLISHKLELPLLYVRKSEKAHGRKKGVEGELEGGNVVLIDDVATTGGSIVEAAETVRGEGGTVKDAVVALDREEGAKEALEREGIELHSCFLISELIDYLREESILDQEKYSLVKEYLE